jgi:hypothetical protein
VQWTGLTEADKIKVSSDAVLGKNMKTLQLYLNIFKKNKKNYINEINVAKSRRIPVAMRYAFPLLLRVCMISQAVVA